MNQTKPSQFGLMLSNLAAAIGVKTAIQTVNTATKTLDQQCDLQEQEARAMGGIGKGPGKGLIMLELDTQVRAAQESGSAIEDSAIGSLVAGGVALAGVLTSLGIFGKVGKDDDLESELKNAEEFKTQLNDGKTGDLEIGEENDQLVTEEHTESTKIKKEMEGLNKSLEDKKADYKKNRADYNKLTKEQSDLRKKFNDLKTKLDQKSTELKQTQETIDKLHEEVDPAINETKPNNVPEEYNKKTNELEQKLKEVSVLKKEHQKLEQESEAAAQAVSKHDVEFVKIGKDSETIENEVDTLENQLTALPQKYDQAIADEKTAGEGKTVAKTKEDAADLVEADARIAKWKGNALKDPDFSNFKKETKELTDEERSELRVNKKALAKIKNGDPRIKKEINHNIERNIARLKEKISAHKTQKQNSWIQVAQQGVTSGTSLAQGSGQMGQGQETVLSQTDQAYGGVLEKVLQNTAQQTSAAASAASTDQGEIANIIQNIAFPA